MVIRKYYNVEGAIIYSSMIIDRTLCRICVFDPEREKSSNGTIIEISKLGYNLNLIDIMLDTFNSIWLEAVPINSNIVLRL